MSSKMEEDGKDDEKQSEEKQDDEIQDVVLQIAELSSAYTFARNEGNKEEASALFNQFITLAKEHNMIEFYRSLCERNNEPIDNKIISEMSDNMNKLLSENDAKKIEAETSEGDVEVHNVELDRGKILRKVSTLEIALKHYDNILNLTTGKNIDKHLEILRLCLAWNDDHTFKKYAETTQKLIDKGGDWDRRNRYTVYNGVHYFRIRNFELAAKGFLDAIATFTANEIFDYKQLVYYTIISSVVSLERTEIKEKLIDSPEIIQIIDDLPVLKSFLNSFYECRYNEFFRSLIELMKDFIRKDFYLSLHSSFYLREIRLRAYSQFLQSYRSVKLSTMAKSFGVNEQFLDDELSSFIASKSLTCKIDKVNGVVEIQRTDKRNTQYHEVIKRGDALLSRIQRLSRVITY